jgi:hypothetical protein
MTHIQVFSLNQGRMGNDRRMDEVVERKVEYNAGYAKHRWDQHSAAQRGLKNAPP